MSQTHTKPDRESPPCTPRWVKVFGIIALVLVLLFVILMLASPGEHGPGRHTAPGGTTSGDIGGYTQPIEHTMQPCTEQRECKP